MQEINKENFQSEVLENDIPVVVDFWASWCGPCMSFAPVFEKVSSEYEGKAKFVKVNTENNEEIAQENGVMSIPTLMVFHNGKELDRIVGSYPEEGFKKKLNEILEKI